MRRLCVCILCCVLMLSMALTAYAAGNVTYYAEADEFVFAPGSNHSPTDLFSNLKGVMPGDTITDQIEIKNHFQRRTDPTVSALFGCPGKHRCVSVSVDADCESEGRIPSL